jgi:hypothetical protein
MIFFQEPSMVFSPIAQTVNQIVFTERITNGKHQQQPAILALAATGVACIRSSCRIEIGSSFARAHV